MQHVDRNATEILEPPLGFFLWIHNDEARPQRIRFEFGRGEEVDLEMLKQELGIRLALAGDGWAKENKFPELTTYSA